jgi:hypothetical protein
MADRHRRRPLSLRLPEEERAWLYAHAGATGQPVRAILRQALAEYRAAHVAAPVPASRRL